MWEQQSKFAVMKEGRKTAVRVFDDKQQAVDYILNNCPDNWKDGHSRDIYNFVERKGKRTRCEDGYCAVSGFCSQFKAYKERNENNDES